MIDVTVYGVPAPQGSKRYVGNGISVESSKAVKPWRADVKNAIEQALPDGHQPWDGPLTQHIVFAFPRPKGHYGTGRNTHRIKPSAPTHPATSRNDLEKLVRAVNDAATAAGLWRDDGLVVQLTATKAYVDQTDLIDRPGCHLTVRRLEPTENA